MDFRDVPRAMSQVCNTGFCPALGFLEKLMWALIQRPRVTVSNVTLNCPLNVWT